MPLYSVKFWLKNMASKPSRGVFFTRLTLYDPERRHRYFTLTGPVAIGHSVPWVTFDEEGDN